jgi:2'-5' RNA ligase
MKLKGNILPGYEVYEYFLIVSLPVAIQEEIIGLRKKFHATFRTIHNIKGRPSLALAHFIQYEAVQTKVVDLFKNIAAFSPPLQISLQNFGSFPTHSIFVKVNEDSGVHKLVKEIRSKAKRNLRVNSETKPMIMLEPHVGIVRKLTPEIYEQSWSKYCDAVFKAGFRAEEMILLRRPPGLKSWQVVERFEFQSKSLPATQGRLF